MYKNLILLGIVLLSNLCFSQNTNSTADSLLLDIISDKIVIGIAAGYSVNDTIQWQFSNGFANLEKKEKFELNTFVRIASISKPITAIAVMQLVEQGLIDLDTPIQTYIPDFPKQEKTQITTRHLLSHTSGIDGYKNAKEAETTENYPTLAHAVDFFKNRKLLFEPGSKYNYTTYGYSVLGLLIEKVSGSSFEVYVRKNIFDKAKMEHTGVVKFGIPIAGQTQLYHREKKGKIECSKENNLSNRIPGGGFYSTVDDLLKLGNAFINGTLVSEATMNLMREHHSLEKENNAYGFGWFLYNPKPNEGGIIGHPGEQTGVSSQLFIVPSTKTVVVVLANTSGSSREVSTIAGNLIKISQKRKK